MHVLVKCEVLCPGGEGQGAEMDRCPSSAFKVQGVHVLGLALRASTHDNGPPISCMMYLIIQVVYPVNERRLLAYGAPVFGKIAPQDRYSAAEKGPPRHITIRS